MRYRYRQGMTYRSPMGRKAMIAAHSVAHPAGP
jgi:hypothetical protein